MAGLPFGLHQWTIGQVIDRAIDGHADLGRLIAAGDPDKIKAAKTWLRNAANAERDKAANLGTRVHDAAASKTPLTKVSTDVAPFLRQYLDWLAESGAEVLHAEKQVWNLSLGYAGTFDLLVRFPKTGLRFVVDLKGLALDTPVATPDGWTTMGEIEVGDVVFDSAGEPTTVLAKSEIRNRPCYRIEFDDGSSVVADDEHRWPVSRSNGSTSVMTTLELHDDLALRHRQSQQRVWGVVNAAPLVTPEANLPIDPYLLGAWLGDGTRRRAAINLSEEKRGIANAFVEAGFTVTEAPTAGKGITFYINGFRKRLRTAGLADADKHVPAAYLRGSAEQRLALLQGLMDTDGTWHKTRRQAVFQVADRCLADAVYELVVSLGWRASRGTHMGHGFGLDVLVHHVAFTPFGRNPFRHVSAKRDAVRIEGTAFGRRRIIKSVTPVEPVPTVCISVGGDHTFLCGDQMVPTHNTGKNTYSEHALQLMGYAMGEFVGEDDIVDRVATDDLLAANGVALLHLSANGWKWQQVTPTPQLFRAFRGLLEFAKFAHEFQDIDGLISAKREGKAP